MLAAMLVVSDNTFGEVMLLKNPRYSPFILAPAEMLYTKFRVYWAPTLKIWKGSCCDTWSYSILDLRMLLRSSEVRSIWQV
jgi:hypothetical protein